MDSASVKSHSEPSGTEQPLPESGIDIRTRGQAHLLAALRQSKKLACRDFGHATRDYPERCLPFFGRPRARVLLELGAGELADAFRPLRALLASAEHPSPPQQEGPVNVVAEHRDLQYVTR